MASTGDLAGTLGGVTLAASGKLAIKGTLGATLGAVTLAAAGIIHVGTLNATLEPVTLAATGKLKIVGSLAATLGAVTLAATNSTKIFFFAWTDEGVAFSSVMLREDEKIFALDITHAEGDFPSLVLDVVNPRIGLLGPGRKQWCWLAWNTGGSIVALFNGRLLGTPENLTAEVVRLQFVARPSAYAAIKFALSDTLKVPPYWDPIWIQEGINDPDTAWETRPELPHIDRVTLEVSSSSILEGEDGIIDISADEHFYDGVKVDPGPQPKRRIKVKGTVTWNQTGQGEVDLTRELVKAFKTAGSPYQYPMVGSYTADGLLTDWPKPEAKIGGGGWSMAPTSSAVAAEFVASTTYPVRWVDKSDSTTVTGFDEWQAGSNSFGSFIISGVGPEKVYHINWKTFEVSFALAPITVDFRVTYAASRKRSEVVSFTVSADIQSILTNPGAAEEEEISLSSAFVDQPVDPGETLPIGDPRRNCFFPTDRGQESLEFLMLLARAKLLSSARAVDIKLASTWEKLALIISCRKSITLHDPRLPGGEATGKIKAYRLAANGEGQMIAEATIGCSIGYGVALADAASGEDTYADDYADDYTESVGGEIPVIAGELHYESLEGTYVVDDDGVDLFDMTPSTVINSLTITGGPNDQRIAIDANLSGVSVGASLSTTGDIVTSGSSSIANLASVVGLVNGTTYNLSGVAIPNPFTTSLLTFHWYGDTRMVMTFNGTDGGPLNHPIPAKTNTRLLISSVSGAVSTPDPLAALEAAYTEVELDLVAVNRGDDFMTEYDVVVLPLVVPMTINLEAA